MKYNLEIEVEKFFRYYFFDLKLTKSQTEVALHALDGLSNKQIAEALFISEKAVKFHFSDIYRKLGESDRNQLIANSYKALVIHLFKKYIEMPQGKIQILQNKGD